MTQATTRAFSIGAYIALTKPGIVMGNTMTAAAGFALGAHANWSVQAFISTLFGLWLIMASGCVFNNAIDRIADSKMTRTKTRPLVIGTVSLHHAVLYGASLGVIGAIILAIGSSFITMTAGLFGFFVYVAIYSFMKYRSWYSTLIGSIAGAVPPIVGYLGAKGALDQGGVILFAIVALWQMPHFFAIAIYRMEEYAQASIPTLPLQKGILATKIHMLLYTIAFVCALVLLYVCGYMTSLYLAVMGALGLGWLGLCIQGFACKDTRLWARRMFIFSLIIITALCVIIPLSKTNSFIN